ncbi:MAG: hypothetical protein SO170_09415 [Butyribacter sp.]|nr:hypothetical protein [bacterium]MDY3855153.1 hypothetical protein [Butyribacter sp.]
MDLFQQLMEEKDRITMAILMKQPVDFSVLRKLAKEFSDKNDAGLVVDGSDQELWDSVTAYFRELLE